MRKVLLCAVFSVLAVSLGCQPSLQTPSEETPVTSQQADKKVKPDAKKEAKKDASTISPELKAKALKRIAEIQGTVVEKDGAIVEVDIMNKAFEPADVELIAQLSDVTKLSISSPSVTDENFALIAKMPKLKNLQMLNCGITDKGLECVPTFPELKVLNLRGCAGISDEGMKFVAKAPKLENLALLYTKITDAGIVAIQDMKLRALDLRGLMLSGTSCQALAKMTTLESLKLRNAREIMDDSFQELKTLVNLTSLSLEDLAITDMAMEALPSMTKLKELVIMRTEIMTVTPIKELKELRKLTLREMPCDLDFLTEMPQLEELFFAESIVRDKDMKFFKGLVNVKTIDMWNTQIGDEALTLFGTLPKLTTVNIKNCAKITDAGIAQLAKSTSLENLNLSENGKATDDNNQPLFTNKSLESLKDCKSLKTLDIKLCPSLTQEAIDAFIKARPDVKVNR